jgi:MFS family permease
MDLFRSQGLRPFSIPGYWRLWANGITGGLSFTTVGLGLGWLILEMTESPGLVGLSAAVSGITVVLLSPVGGTLADRYNRRNLLIAAQIAQGLTYLTLGLLTLFEVVEYWHVLLVAVAIGSSRSVLMPSRGALTFDLVGRRSILNAETLNFMGINISQMLGPVGAGFLLAVWGADVFFITMSLVYMAGTTLLIGVPSAPSVRSFTGSRWRDLSAGMNFCLRDRSTRTVVLVVLVTESLGFSILMMLPVAVRELLMEDARALGVLAGSFGVGGTVATLAITAIGDVRHRAWLLMGASFTMGLSIVAFSRSTSFPLSMALIFVAGLSGTVYDVMNGTLFQTLTPGHMRGRVLAVRSTLMSGASTGAGAVGGAAERIGVALALTLAGTAVAVNALRILPVGKMIDARSQGPEPPAAQRIPGAEAP